MSKGTENSHHKYITISGENPNNPLTGPEGAAYHKERAQALITALAALSETDLLAMLMRLRGHELPAISRALGISEGAVRVQIHRARFKLREQLEKLGFVEKPEL